MFLKQGKYLLNNLLKAKHFTPKSIGVFSSRNYVDTNLDTLKHLKLDKSEKVIYMLNDFLRTQFQILFQIKKSSDS
jgi:hypothetical protein